MHNVGYLASSVTVDTSLLKHRGFEGRAAVQQRGRRMELGAVSSKFLTKSTFLSNSRLQL